MTLKSLPYLVIMLLMWSWVDDLLVSTSNDVPGDDVATSENDEYLPSGSVSIQERLSDDCSPLLDVSKMHTVSNIPPFTTSKPHSKSERDLLSSTEPLYALMSLQC